MLNGIRNYWTNELRPVTPHKNLEELPGETVGFLLDVGLPTNQKLYEDKLTFLRATIPLKSLLPTVEEDITDRLFQFFTNDLSMVQFEERDYVSIGQYGEKIVGLARGTGEVYLLDSQEPPPCYPYPYHPVTFVNTNIECCLTFLMYDSYYHSLMIEPIVKYNRTIGILGKEQEQEVAKSEVTSLIARLEQQLRDSDKRALNESVSYWRFYMFDLKQSWGDNTEGF